MPFLRVAIFLPNESILFHNRAKKAGHKKLQGYLQELQSMPQFKKIKWRIVLDKY
jgi:hypothetical protein